MLLIPSKIERNQRYAWVRDKPVVHPFGISLHTLTHQAKEGHKSNQNPYSCNRKMDSAPLKFLLHNVLLYRD
jgi:hypothetical protein